MQFVRFSHRLSCMEQLSRGHYQSLQFQSPWTTGVQRLPRQHNYRVSSSLEDNKLLVETLVAMPPGYHVCKTHIFSRVHTNEKTESPITCSNTKFICATLRTFGVYGCCDPASLTECVIPTACVASTAMSSSCSDAACTSNAAILKCTDSALPECYRWSFVFSTTTVTQNGCAAKGFTRTALWSVGQLPSSIPPEFHVTETASASPSSTPTLVQTASSKPAIGPIVGGVVGGCAFLGIIATIAVVLNRRRRNSIQQPPTARFYDGHGVTEYNPDGSSMFIPNDNKTWQQQPGPVHRESNSMPQYPGMGMGQYGVVEVDGVERAVEAPASAVHLAQPKHQA